MEDNIPKRWLIFGAIIVLLFIGGCSTRVFFYTFVDSYEIGYKFDKATGQTTVLKHTGYARITPFFSEVHTVDLRPMQIRIEANNRVLNAMLVKFKAGDINPDGSYKNYNGLMQFLELHGRSDYNQTVLSDILKSYAYEGYGSNAYNRDELQKKYKFLEILGNTASGNDQSSHLKIDSTYETK